MPNFRGFFSLVNQDDNNILYEVSVGSDGNVLKLAAGVAQHSDCDDTNNYNLKW